MVVPAPETLVFEWTPRACDALMKFLTNFLWNVLPCLFIFPSLGTKFGMKGMRPQPQLRVNLVPWCPPGSASYYKSSCHRMSNLLPGLLTHITEPYFMGWSILWDFLAILLVRVDSISWDVLGLVPPPPGWILETLNDLVVAGKCVGAPAALELQCCGPPPDVSATLSG